MKLNTKGLWDTLSGRREMSRRTKLYRTWRKRYKKVARQQRKVNQQHG